MKKFLNDTLIGKIIKTFIEGFLASLILALGNVNDFSNEKLLESIFIGAIAMGLSAVLNLIQNKINKGE